MVRTGLSTHTINHAHWPHAVSQKRSQLLAANPAASVTDRISYLARISDAEVGPASAKVCRITVVVKPGYKPRRRISLWRDWQLCDARRHRHSSHALVKLWHCFVPA